MKKNKISVIVPVYNTGKYVDKCLKSLLNQTYKNIEIIVVDDCSTDNSREVLKKYKDKVKILCNNKNFGAGYSRNRALDVATGDYISFIDSDDYIDLDYYEKLLNAMVKGNADIAICDIKIVYEDTGMELISRACETSELTIENIVNNGLSASPCNKLFKRSALKYKFSLGKMNEDIEVVIPSLVNAKKIAYAKTYYHYIQHKGSIQNSDFSDKRFDIFDGVKTTLERIKNNKNYEELKSILVYNQLIVLLIYVIPKEKNKKNRKEILRKYNELSSEYNIRQNHYFGNFLESCGNKHRLYYKLLFKLNCERHYILANQLISMYDILYKILRPKPIIDENINLNSVIDMAKYQNSLSDEKIKISVVVPNYNYARFMYQRVYSILRQNYKIYELIILDDKSTDNSKEVIDEMHDNIKEFVNVKLIYNKTNSGTAFKQWEKGFNEATGDYVWIAEADDYCEDYLLNTLVKPIESDDNIMISYCDTAFIDVFGNIILKSIKSEIDIRKTGHWDKSYANTGVNEIKDYSFLNCTIANVSSCIIKNGNYEDYFKLSGEYKQAGDWLFYINVMSMGDIAYSNKILNYYRVHGNNVSSVMDKERHLREIKRIHEFCRKKFKLDKKHDIMIQERINFLKKVWKIETKIEGDEVK